jgi:hypothetical protein
MRVSLDLCILHSTNEKMAQVGTCIYVKVLILQISFYLQHLSRWSFANLWGTWTSYLLVNLSTVEPRCWKAKAKLCLSKHDSHVSGALLQCVGWSRGLGGFQYAQKYRTFVRLVGGWC